MSFHALPCSGLRDKEFWLCMLLLEVGKTNLELRVWTCKSAEVAHAKSVNRKGKRSMKDLRGESLLGEKTKKRRRFREMSYSFQRCGVVLIRAMLQRGEH